MTSPAESAMPAVPPRVSSLARWIRIVYLLFAGLFAVGIVLQVFFAGAGVLVNAQYFRTHSIVGHLLEMLPLIMLPLGLVGRLPWKVVAITALLFFLFMLQYVFLYAAGRITGMPELRALHAVNALALFWAALYLVQRTWSLVRLDRPRNQQATSPAS